MPNDARKKKGAKPKKVGGKSNPLYMRPSVSNMWRVETDAPVISSMVSSTSNILQLPQPPTNLVPGTNIQVDTRPTNTIFNDFINRRSYELGLDASDLAVRTTLTSDFIKEQKNFSNPTPQFSFLTAQPDKQEDPVAVLTKKMEQQETAQKADAEATKKDVFNLEAKVEATKKELAATIDEQEKIKSHFDYFKNPNNLVSLLSDTDSFRTFARVTAKNFGRRFGKIAFMPRCGICGSESRGAKKIETIDQLMCILKIQRANGTFLKCNDGKHLMKFIVADDEIVVVSSYK